MTDQAENEQPAEENKPAIGSVEESRYGKLRYTSIESEMKQSYLDYAMSVIVSRALPDVRDGLKPVHRRILYSMYKSGIHHTSSYKKSARIVGDVLGKYHPHGDAPVYMALVRLAQDFSMRYQLIDGQGNFGSVDGDSPAAMRYTEARLARISSELLVDLDKETVPMGDNFDGSLKEPLVMPAKLPNLLLMGSEGIAVGMATKIPPHNLVEICQAILLVLKNSKATIEPQVVEATETTQTQAALIEKLAQTDPKVLSGTLISETTIDNIMEIIKGPDFPTGGIMYDSKAIIEGYRTGKGRVVMRAKAEIVEDKKGFQIIVTELPYQVNKARLLMKIADLVRDKKIVGIRDLNDDSDRKGMQITIELKRDAIPKVVLNKLFKYSELQTSFPMNMVALNSEGTPQLMNIRQILLEYLGHRQVIIVRRTQYELVAAGKRAHILEGLLIALKNLDEVIETIRKSPDTETAKVQLMKRFGLSELQALAILEMQLKRLAALERQKIEDEYKQIQETIKKLLVLLQDPQAILEVISQETEELITTYGDERKTRLVKGKIGEMSEEDLIPEETTVITLTQTGYIKRLNPTAFRSQSRGGKGSIGVKMKDEDVVQSLLTASTHDTLLLFTNLGRVFKLKAHEIPETQRQAKGTAVVNLLSLQTEEVVRSLLVIDEQADAEKYISLATKKGLIKKTAVSLFNNIRQNGIIAITLNSDDQLVWGKLTSGEDDILLITHEGKCIRFSETQVKASQRDTKGVKGISLRASDYVVGVEAISENLDKTDHLLVITENGMGKRTPLSQYPAQKRSGLGVKVSDITKRTGAVAAALRVDETFEEVVISTKDGQTIKLPLTKKSIPILTRPTQGVILMRLKEDDAVVAVALTYKEVE
ncbi:MAG: DNA gyrase subunit A [Candidatus Pacebacteria bacterium CG10_big_fil_rev_8_21_14_0_10_44_54]|nr:MAG: DNA gyrase subunit A [Candidatus Pacebacteria bacterium CG10_big_fil_rev_8_21_14_0_10_44_54]